MQRNLTRNNLILLICLLIVVFFFPVLSIHRKLLLDIIFTAIILAGTFSLEFDPKKRNILLFFGTVTILAIWFDIFISNSYLNIASIFFFFSFNIIITVFIVRHIGRSKDVTLTILINSINGYLFIGILGALLLAIVDKIRVDVFHLDDGGINFAGNAAQGFHDYIYFSFVTMTTLGYGDITPVSSIIKSVSIFIAIAGQLYLTILVAMLVGKFLTRSAPD